MAGFGYDRVQVLLVTCSVRVTEESFGKLAIFLGDEGWLVMVLVKQVLA
jgi:hypothetical protein